MSKPLTTLQSCNDVLGLQTGDDPINDRLVMRYIRVASDLFEKLTNVVWSYEPTVVQKMPSKGGRSLYGFSNLPLLSVSEVRYQDQVQDEDGYEIDGIMLTRKSNQGWWHNTDYYDNTSYVSSRKSSYEASKDYQITYEAGYITPQQAIDDDSLERTLPYDLEDAIIEFVKFKYLNSDRNEGIASESTDAWSISYAQGIDNVPSTFKGMVRKYRVYLL